MFTSQAETWMFKEGNEDAKICEGVSQSDGEFFSCLRFQKLLNKDSKQYKKAMDCFKKHIKADKFYRCLYDIEQEGDN